MGRAFRISIILAGCILPFAAKSDPYRIYRNIQPPGPDAPIGCYWMDGEQFCSRYCYWEVDGRRFCREQKDLAVPQGPLPEANARLREEPVQLYKPYK
jgi:hypothetical protein